MRKIFEVHISTIDQVKYTLRELDLLNDFELQFLRSICSYSKYRTVKLSEKQFNIYKGLKEIFDSLDIFDRYTAWFKYQEIELDDFEKGYLETYKGEFERTEAFERFLKQTINKPK